MGSAAKYRYASGVSRRRRKRVVTMVFSGALDSPAASVGMSAATLTVLVLVMRRFLTFLKNNTKNAMVNTYVVPPLVFAAMGGIGFMLRAVLLELWTRIRKRYITTLR